MSTASCGRRVGVVWASSSHPVSRWSLFGRKGGLFLSNSMDFDQFNWSINRFNLPLCVCIRPPICKPTHQLPPFCSPLCALFSFSVLISIFVSTLFRTDWNPNSFNQLIDCHHFVFQLIFFPYTRLFSSFFFYSHRSAILFLLVYRRFRPSKPANQLIDQSTISSIDCSKFVIFASCGRCAKQRPRPIRVGCPVLPPPMVVPLLLWARASSVFVSCVPAFDLDGPRFFCSFDLNRFDCFSINRIDWSIDGWLVLSLFGFSSFFLSSCRWFFSPSDCVCAVDFPSVVTLSASLGLVCVCLSFSDQFVAVSLHTHSLV